MKEETCAMFNVNMKERKGSFVVPQSSFFPVFNHDTYLLKSYSTGKRC